MRFLRSLFVVLIISARSPSQESTLKKLQGHWHLINSPDRYTMDIDDSSALLSRYSLQYEELRLPLFDSANSIVLPVPCGCGDSILPAMDEFSILGNTLVYDNEEILDYCQTSTLKFYKSEIESCKWTHYVYQEDLTVRLALANSDIIEIDSVKETSLTTLISIGPAKNPELGTNSKIQHRGVLSSINDIPRFISNTQEHYKFQYPRNIVHFKNKKLISVVLALDSTVRKSFADSVIKAIPKYDSIKVFRLVSKKGSNELGLEQID